MPKRRLVLFGVCFFSSQFQQVLNPAERKSRCPSALYTSRGKPVEFVSACAGIGPACTLPDKIN
jgi:hypothetical protein